MGTFLSLKVFIKIPVSLHGVCFVSIFSSSIRFLMENSYQTLELKMLQILFWILSVGNSASTGMRKTTCLLKSNVTYLMEYSFQHCVKLC